MIIYLITNIVNGKKYIGRTKRGIEHRFRAHLHSSKQGSNTYFHKAIRKYGKENFKLEILEESDREEHWIEILKPEYNMTKGGDGGDTSKSPNFIKAMKIMHQNKPKEEYATYGMLGKSINEKTKIALIKANSCPIIFNDVKYNSIKEAELANPNISVRKRIDSHLHPTCYRLRATIRRK